MILVTYFVYFSNVSFTQRILSLTIELNKAIPLNCVTCIDNHFELSVRRNPNQRIRGGKYNH